MTKRRNRIKPRASRPARVPTPGLRCRLGDVECAIGNLSPTGALLLTRHEIPLETEWSLQFELSATTVTVKCRVVRCESMEIQMPGAVWRRKDSAVGVVFENVAAPARQAIRQFCKTSVPIEESAPRVLVIGADPELSKLISRTLAEAEYVPRIITELREAPQVARRIGAKVAVINLEGGGQRMFDVVEVLRSGAAAGSMPIIGCAEIGLLSERQRSHLSEQRVRLLALPLTPEELIDAVDRAVLDPPFAEG
jgi:CheY-like chemotaxis protein